MKFRIGDSVIVKTGNDRGKTGVITKFFLKANKVAVDGINKKVRHIKGRNGEPGQKVDIFAPIDVSNIAVADPKTGKATRIGYKAEAGEKVRMAKKSGTVLPKTTKAKKEKPAKK